MKKNMKKAADGIRMKPSSVFTPSKISKELNFKKSEPIDFSYKPAAKKVETKPIKKTRVEKVEDRAENKIKRIKSKTEKKINRIEDRVENKVDKTAKRAAFKTAKANIKTVAKANLKAARKSFKK